MTGPGPGFDLVLTMHAGGTAALIGKNTASNYWIVSNPAGGSCWMENQYAVVTGDTSVLPEFPAPDQAARAATELPKATKTPKPRSTATSTVQPTLSVPRAPGNLALSVRTCGPSTNAQGESIWKQTVTLTWEDSDTETAYRLYRNGTAYTTVVEQDSASWPIYLEYVSNVNNGIQYDLFELEAYNSAGVSGKASVYVNRCYYPP